MNSYKHVLEKERKDNWVAQSESQATGQSFRVLSVGAFVNLHSPTIVLYLQEANTKSPSLLQLAADAADVAWEVVLIMCKSSSLAEFVTHGQCVRSSYGLASAICDHVGIGMKSRKCQS